jgi:VanZ family protein
VSAPRHRLLKAFRRPGLWLAPWLCAVLAVVVLSLVPPPPMAVPAHTDKVEHLLAYAVLALGAVQLFPRGRVLLAIGLALVGLGAGLEWAQGALTTTRMADPADAAANTLGVLLGLGTAASRWRDALLQWEQRRLR